MKNLIPIFILEKFKENKVSGNFKAITMFIDISGFTAMTQTLMKNGKEGAEILSEIINIIYTPSIKTVYDHNGFITTFAGDAFTSIFPYKDSKPIFAVNAVQQIKEIFGEIGKQKTKFGEYDLSIKIGLSYGNVNWGIIKSDKLNSYYFKGEAIDNCARSEQNTAKSEIIFDEVVLHKIQNKVTFTEKTKSYYLLKSLTKALKPTIQKTSSKRYSQTDFIPESILKLKTIGEFRDIISCFISFEDSRNWKQAITTIIDITQIYGGYFNKIDFGDKGGNILVLFGAPVGKEKIFSRACGFAQAILNIPNLNTRIGLTYGTVFAGFVGSELRCEYTALGMVINLSARFMMKANYGEIYIDKSIKKHIQNRYEINKLSKQKFKGFKEKISIYILEKKKEHKMSFEGKLIGRQKELQKLKRTLKPIQNNKFGGIVYVHGIAGIGKSRLVAELTNLVILSRVEESKSKYNWFYLPCDEILRKSFNPFTHFLKSYFEQSEENTKQVNRSNFERKLESIIKLTKDKAIKNELIRTKSILGAMVNVTWTNSLYEQLDAKGRFENSLYAVKNLIKAESLQKPVILELEDGHWIESDSRKLLKVLTTNIEKYPIIIISACRLKDEGSLFNFDLKEVPQKNINLEHLEKESSRKMIENKLNGKVSEKLFNLIWQKSEGNPFYIEQIILHLQETGFIDEKLDLTIKDIEIPKTINSIIVARIDRLTTELKELVQTASVLGREFAVNILSAMLNRKEIHKELTEGERENIWNALTQINYIFKHALIRETIYEMQLKKQLRKLHKLAAKTIEDIHKQDLKEFFGELANHYEKAEVKEKTIEYLEKAGDFAKENYKNEQALEFYERLLEYQISIGLRIDSLLKKSDLLELIGKWKEAEEIIRNAFKLSEEIDDKKRILKSTSYLGWQLSLKSNYEKAVECYEKWLKMAEEIGDKEAIAGAIGNIGIVYRNQGYNDKAMKYYEKWLKMTEELGDKEGISKAVGNMGNIYTDQGNYKKAMECFEKLLLISVELGRKEGISRAFGYMGVLYSQQGIYVKAIEYYKKDLKICEEIGYKNGISGAVGNLGEVYRIQGYYKNAMEYFVKYLTICKELADKRGISKAYGYMGGVYRNLGNYEKALKYYKQDLQICEELGNKIGISAAIGNMGNVYYNQGNYEKAVACYRKDLQICEELGNKKGSSIAIGNLGNVYFDQGNNKKAMEYNEKCLKIFEEFGYKNGISIIVGNMGNIYRNQGNFEKSIECYEKAISLGRYLDIKYNLCSYLYYKADLFYQLNNIEADSINKESLEIALEVGRKDTIFYSKILKEKINFKHTDDSQNRLQNIENLKTLLKGEKEDSNIALLNYELSIMNYELGRKEIVEKHKKKAILLLKKLCKKTPRIDFKNKIEVLEKL